MYVFYRIRDVVRIPPQHLGQPLNEVAARVLRDRYEGVLDKDLGIVVAVTNVSVNEMGVIVPGDGATYHEAEFDVVAFKPLLHEVVEGRIVEARDFGIFISLGPIDGLIHKSQILDDELNYDSAKGVFTGKRTARKVGIGDVVRARIVQIGASSLTRPPRVALTMRQPFLGKLEWIREDVRRVRGGGKER